MNEEGVTLPMTDASLDLNLSKLMGLDRQIDELKAQLKNLNEEYDRLNWKITQYMQQTNCDGKKIYGKNFILTSRTFTKVEDPVAFENWVEEKDAWKLVMMRSASKLNAFCKESLEQGLEIPAGVTPGHIEQYIQIRQG